MFDVRTADGSLLKRVSRGAAEELLSRGWAEPIGRGKRQYVRLTESAPLSSLHGWGSRTATRPMRGSEGQLLVCGDKRARLEHSNT